MKIIFTFLAIFFFVNLLSAAIGYKKLSVLSKNEITKIMDNYRVDISSGGK